MRAYEQSQLRLGIPTYDLLVIHDLDQINHQPPAKLAAYFGQLATSGWRAISELKSAGLVRGVGAGINDLGLIPQFLELVDVDFFLVASSYSLYSQEMLASEFPAAVARGVGFIVAPFQSGALAHGAAVGAASTSKSPEVSDRLRRIEAVCARYRVPMPAAALQFPLGHPSVAAVIPGASTPEHVECNVADFRLAIPAELWAALKHEGLLREDAPTPA
jgi:D-threo-aldose 1-dehydrogenase